MTAERLICSRRCSVSEPSKCPRCGTENCVGVPGSATTAKPIEGWEVPVILADIACSLRALVEHGRKPLSASKTFSPQMPAGQDAEPVIVDFS